LVLLKNLIQELTARLLEYQDCTPFVTSERVRLSCTRWTEFGGDRVLVLQPLETLRKWLFSRKSDHQDRRWVAVPSAAIKGEVLAFPDGLQRVPRRLVHGGHPRRHGCTASELIILTVFVLSWISYEFVLVAKSPLRRIFNLAPTVRKSLGGMPTFR
jgi:hypothetical protein